jgi:hypothetical protein
MFLPFNIYEHSVNIKDKLLRSNMKNIAVFCGAHEIVDPKYKAVATRCGELIARHGLTLIYGGSNAGLMARVSDATVDNGGKVIGIYPSILNDKEPFSEKITTAIIVDNMSVRKDVMITNADAFVILPGGVGTLDELFEIITLKILGGHNKPIIIVNTDGYWNKLGELCESMVNEKFVDSIVFETYRMVATPEEAFKRLGFE